MSGLHKSLRIPIPAESLRIQIVGVPAWLTRLLIRSGPLCHLCGYGVDLVSHHNYKLSPSRDHVIPNPFTNKSGYRKRTVRDPNHELNQPGNILLSHRYCNAARGQQEVTDELRSTIRIRIEKFYPPAKFAELQIGYAAWREKILNPEIKPLCSTLNGHKRARFIAAQRTKLEWKEELQNAERERKEAA